MNIFENLIIGPILILLGIVFIVNAANYVNDGVEIALLVILGLAFIGSGSILVLDYFEFERRTST